MQLLLKKVQNLVMEDRHLTVRETAEQVEVTVQVPHVQFCVIMRRMLRNLFPSFCRWNRKSPSCSCTGSINTKPDLFRLLAIPENENANRRIE
ncbi:hypothetical protein TNCV_4972451 [Trichonephila clavipes]|nr:hypothetical protein TNCV_4972451 [Trichonephila clavipes]